MRELSLFTGVGGGLLGTKLLGWRTVGYVENNKYCQNILLQRIEDGMLNPAPVFGDIRDFNKDYARAYSGMVDIVTAGFPCQPLSVAGQKKGSDDERNMWPSTIECIRVVRPGFCLLENVPGLLTHDYFGTILGDLAESGYDCRWRILSAAELGAPHLRDRVWIMAYSSGIRLQGQCQAQSKSHQGWMDESERLLEVEGKLAVPTGQFSCLHDGVANRMDRLKALGNSQVPAVVARVWEELTSR